jgi:hypothetical protein
MFGGAPKRPRSPRRKSTPTPLLHDTPQAKAVQEAGGVLVYCPLPTPEAWSHMIARETAVKASYAPGCGEPVFVVGPNPMPCGALLTDLRNNTAPQYCPTCKAKRDLIH